MSGLAGGFVQVDEGVAGYGTTEQITLLRIASEFAEKFLLGKGLVAVGRNPPMQCLARGDDGRDDGGIFRILYQLADEALVDLQLAGRQPLEIQQAGIAGAKVVDRNFYAQLVQL